MSKVHVKTGDTVVLLTGRYEDKYTGKGDRKVIVEGINMITKHVKPVRMGEKGGIVRTEAPVYACKVQLVCPKCGKPTRVGHVFEDGKKLRVCKKCGKAFD